MRRFLIVALFVFSARSVARADSFQVFNLSASLAGSFVATGSVTLDSTTGVFTGEDITVSSPGPLFPSQRSSFVFTSISQQQSVSYPVFVPGNPNPVSEVPVYSVFSFFYDPVYTNEEYAFQFVIPYANAVGYPGSALCTVTSPCGITTGLFLSFSNFFVYAPDYGIEFPNVYNVSSGTLTPAPPIATPEPSSVWLLGTGLFLVGLMAGKRLKIA